MEAAGWAYGIPPGIHARPAPEIPEAEFLAFAMADGDRAHFSVHLIRTHTQYDLTVRELLLATRRMTARDPERQMTDGGIAAVGPIDVMRARIEVKNELGSSVVHRQMFARDGAAYTLECTYDMPVSELYESACRGVHASLRVAGRGDQRESRPAAGMR